MQFGANTVEFDNSIKGINKALSGLRNEFTTINRDLKFDPTNVENYNKKLENLQEQARLSREKINQLKEDQDALGEGKIGTSAWNDLQLQIENTEGKIKSVEIAIGRTQKSIEDLDPKSIKSLETQFDDLEKQIDIVDRKIALDPNNMDAIQEKVGLLEDELVNTEDRADALRKELAKVDDEQIDTQEAKDLQYELDNAELQADELRKAIEKVDPNSLENVSKSVQDLGQKMTDTGKKLTTYATLPIVGGFAAAIKVGNDFEAQMSRVGAIAGSNEEELKSMSDQAVTLGADTSFSATEAATGMESLASAGFSANQIMSSIPGTLDLAAVSGGDVAIAAENMTTALNGFGLEADSAGHVSDVFAQAAASTNAEVADMGEAMKYVAPVAGSLGVSLEDSAAAIGTMSDAGIKGGQAGTTLRAAMLRLSAPTDEAAGAMEEIGLNAFDAEGNMKTLPQLVNDLGSAMEGLTSEEKTGFISTIFGKEAASGILALVNTGGPALDELSEKFKNADGAAQNMATQMQDNSKSKVEELGGSLESMGIKIQETLQPTLDKIVGSIKDLIDKFLELDEDTQDTIITIALVVAVLGPLLIIIGTMISIVGKAMEGFKLLNSVMAANPIILIVAAVAALIAALVYFFTQTETGKKMWSEFTTWISEKLAELVAWFKEKWEEVKKFFSDLWEGIKDIFAKVWAWIDDHIIQKVIDFIKNIKEKFEEAKKFMSDLWDGIKTKITEIWDGIKQFFEDTWANIKAKIDEVWLPIKDFFTNIWNDIKTAVSDAITSMFDNIKSKFDSIKQTISDKLENAKTAVLDAWISIKQFFADGITGAIEKVTGIGDKISDFFKEIPDKIKNAIGNLTDIGKKIVDDILNGIGNIGQKIRDKISAGIDSAKSALGNVWDSITGKSYGGSFENFGGAVQSIFRIKGPNNTLPYVLKAAGAPGATSNTNSTTNNININVNSNSSNGLDIARAVERQIVRRLSK